MQQQDSVSPVNEPQKEETDDASQFNKSLQELRDLCSQLYHAADYCETSYLNAKEKRMIVENTKEYVCRAVVTVVDHLGSVSANLDYRLSKTNVVPDTELRIDSLKQRLSMCQKYSHKCALSKYCWRADFPRYHPRYILPPISDNGKYEVSRESVSSTPGKAANTRKFEIDTEMPLFLYTHNYKPSLMDNTTKATGKEKSSTYSIAVLPVPDGISVLPKHKHPSFQFQEARKSKRNSIMLNWKSVQNKDFVSLIRKGRRSFT